MIFSDPDPTFQVCFGFCMKHWISLHLKSVARPTRSLSLKLRRDISYCRMFRIRTNNLRIRIRILLVSSLAFKLETKNNFFAYYLLFECSFIYISLPKSHKWVTKKFFLIFFYCDERIWIRTKNAGTRSGRPKNVRVRIDNTVSKQVSMSRRSICGSLNSWARTRPTSSSTHSSTSTQSISRYYSISCQRFI
jgi:hypothetical protein